MRVFVNWRDWFDEERELPLEVDPESTFEQFLIQIQNETDLPMANYDLYLHKYEIKSLNGYNETQPLSWLLSENARLTLRPIPGTLPPATNSVGQGAQCNGEVEMSPTPTFLLEDVKEWRPYLATQGYVVLRDMLTPAEVDQARDLLWNWLSEISQGKLKRGQPETWNDPSWPASKDTGIVDGSGIGQCELNWFLRTRPTVVRAFQLLWSQDEVLTSFDGAALFRPWSDHPELKTQGGWYHVDQNANSTDLIGKNVDGLACVQGIIPLFPADPSTGGLTVLPKSHLEHVAVCQRALVSRSHYVPLDMREPVLQLAAKLVCAPAGALCLWDSRLIHCNSPGKPLPSLLNTTTADSLVCLHCGRVFASSLMRRQHQSSTSHPHCLPDHRHLKFHAENNTELLRAVCMVCMTPAQWADAQVREQRRTCWENHLTTSHWPHLPIRGSTKPERFVPHRQPLTDQQKALIG